MRLDQPMSDQGESLDTEELRVERPQKKGERNKLINHVTDRQGFDKLKRIHERLLTDESGKISFTNED